MGAGSDYISCIGDSHALFFSGQDIIQPVWPGRSHDLLPCFRTYRLGPVLAYNLCKTETLSRGREKLFEVLEKCVPEGGTVLTCFGEIDCRLHLPKQAAQQNRSLDSVVAECVGRYFSVILEVVARGHCVIVWNVPPSTTRQDTSSWQFPAYGTCEERNTTTVLFNRHLEEKCHASGVSFLSVFDALVDNSGLTRSPFYLDDVHLSQRAMPLVVRALETVAPGTITMEEHDRHARRRWAKGRLRLRKALRLCLSGPLCRLLARTKKLGRGVLRCCSRLRDHPQK